jgi:hypothetical protein
MTQRITLFRSIAQRAATMPDAPLAVIFPQAWQLATCDAAPAHYAPDARATERRRTAWQALHIARAARQAARRRRAMHIIHTAAPDGAA